ncbi:MAG: hypothetical protein F6J98_27390, partial [Moorea sp. SIO4G2]|nr:hypothetical protein [Moorena sp. SIO4G2]
MNFAQGMYGIAIIYVLINKAENAGLSAIKERKNRIFVLFRRGGASRVVNKACRVSVRAASAKADTVGWSWQE